MGKYQDWLHFRAADQHLRAQLAALEQEFSRLHEQAHLLQQALPTLDNQLIALLLASPQDAPPTTNGSVSGRNSFSLEEAATPQEFATSIPEQATRKQPAAISPPLLVWSSLPDLVPTTPSGETQPDAVLPPVLSRNSLLALPASSSNALAAARQPSQAAGSLIDHSHRLEDMAGFNRDIAVDQESMRTSQLIERWQQRWGRQLPPQDEAANHRSAAHE